MSCQPFPQQANAQLAAIVVMTAAALMACAQSSSHGAASSSSYQLIRAEHQDCQQQGEALATYLDTGRPTSNDPTYGSDRQQVLNLPGEKRDLYIRQTADAYIRQCDQQEDAAAAAAAQAAADAKAQADAAAQAQAAAQHKVDVQAKEQATCAAVGGHWSTAFGAGGCDIEYRSKDDGQVYHYGVSFDDNADVVPSLGLPENASAAACADYGRQLGDPAVVWHPDTMICAL